MIQVVYATGTAVVELPTGGRARVLKGTHWPASDFVVRTRPDLFSSDPRWGLFYTSEPDGYDAPMVEMATSAPGERRDVPRPPRR